ncbi:protein of unknown function [Chryseobacterium sp. JV274]|nr:protein of unknown function [Chryseobacterium sp. JV274]
MVNIKFSTATIFTHFSKFIMSSKTSQCRVLKSLPPHNNSPFIGEAKFTITHLFILIQHRLINVKALISSRYIVKFEVWKILEKIYYEK